jgi:uncharacterized membrane-anchored protein YitT (DUF2179 family)
MDYKKILIQAKNYFLITVGLAIFAFGWAAFLIPSKIVGGGVAGISTLLYYTFKIPVGIWYLIINIGLIILGWKYMGKKFVINTIFGILMNSALLTILQPLFHTPLVHDQFMAALIGGGLAGAGLGIAFANGGNSGGTDIIALIISHHRNISPGKIIMSIDILIIASSYLVFHSVEKIVYGYVVMAVVSYTLDLVLEGERQSFQFIVFSQKNPLIAEKISTQVHRGVTLWRGYGWYSKKEFEILLVIGRKHDKTQIMRIIKETDPTAFVSVSKVQGVFGRNFERLKV